MPQFGVLSSSSFLQSFVVGDNGADDTALVCDHFRLE
uniref:Uncharacterized protein n=1 Tax=Arundo donax TaxID=35708 RepID=A0A0A9HL65_ARUDO